MSKSKTTDERHEELVKLLTRIAVAVERQPHVHIPPPQPVAPWRIGDYPPYIGGDKFITTTATGKFTINSKELDSE